MAEEQTAPKMNATQVDHAAFPFWYSIFRPYTFESRLIELPEDFVAYLHRDGVVLPPSLEAKQHHGEPDSDDEGGWDEEGAEWVGSEFVELQRTIAEHLEQLGGRAFIKLNWSAPKVRQPGPRTLRSAERIRI